MLCTPQSYARSPPSDAVSCDCLHRPVVALLSSLTVFHTMLIVIQCRLRVINERGVPLHTAVACRPSAMTKRLPALLQHTGVLRVRLRAVLDVPPGRTLLRVRRAGWLPLVRVSLRAEGTEGGTSVVEESWG